MVKLNIDLPDSFFLEEERDGYLVSAKFKELWAVQLDLLNEFDRVCKKYSIKYFLDFGSMLGAVRHKGFIPWDEDIDVSMLRKDYDRLMEVGPIEFTDPYFLQNHQTDSHYDNSVARLRRSDTTFLQGDNIQNCSKFNLGVFIDIFVFDNVPTNDPKTLELIHSECNSLWYRGYILANPPALFHGAQLPIRIVQYLYNKIKYGSSSRMFKKLDAAARRFESSEYVSIIFTASQRTYCFPRKLLEETIRVPFEILSVPIPKEYNAILKRYYGDYMKPVIEDIKTTGKLCFVDTNHSYKELVKKKNFFQDICNDMSMDLQRDYGSLFCNLKELGKIIYKKIKR